MVRYGDENEPRGTLDKLAPLFCGVKTVLFLASGVRSVVLVELPLKCFLGKRRSLAPAYPVGFSCGAAA